MDKVILCELLKKMKFDHTNKWHMHNPASVLENKTHTHFQDFDIQTDHEISASQPCLILFNNKKDNMKNCGLCCLGSS